MIHYSFIPLAFHIQSIQLMLPALLSKYSQYPTISIHLHCYYLSSDLLTGHHAVSSSPITICFKNSNQDDVFEAWVRACRSYPKNTLMASPLPQLMSWSVNHDPQDPSRSSHLLILWPLSPSPGATLASGSPSGTWSQPLPQGLCKYCELCLESSSPKYPRDLCFTSHRSLFK